MDVRELHNALLNQYGNDYDPALMIQPLPNTPIDSGVGFIDENGVWQFSPLNTEYPHPEPSTWLLNEPLAGPIYFAPILGLHPLLPTPDDQRTGIVPVIEWQGKEFYFLEPSFIKSSPSTLKEVISGHGIYLYSSDYRKFSDFDDFLGYEVEYLSSLRRKWESTIAEINEASGAEH
jgi:hypothetical protein